MKDKQATKKKTRDELMRFGDMRNQTDADRHFSKRMNDYFSKGPGTNLDKLKNFAKYVPRQILAGFLAKHSIYQHICSIHGHIIECGVFLGGGLMTWAQLSSIYEPYNHTRRIVGFDTFAGFPAIHAKDKGKPLKILKKGGLAVSAEDDLYECINLYDLNRPVGHIPRVELVRGDAVNTIPEYLKQNQHLVVALLYLDFDLYEPTKVAIETFLPRMPRGAIIVFDELNQSAWPGETMAVLETVGIRDLKIKRFPFTPQISYAQLE